MATVQKFLVVGLCPETNISNPRATKALELNPFPFEVTVRIVGDLSPCPKCGAKRYKLTTQSQVETEERFGFVTREERTVCEGMGNLI